MGDSDETAVYSDAQRAQLGVARQGETGAQGERGERGRQGPRGRSWTLPLVFSVAALSLSLGVLLGSCQWFL